MNSDPACGLQSRDAGSLFESSVASLPISIAATQAGLAAELTARYRLIRRLGEGGMGVVFLAEQIALGNRPVALKVLRRQFLDCPEFLQRFHEEADSTARIRHHNVVTIYEWGQLEDGLPYIAMEYIDGQSLREILKRRGALPAVEAAEILRQIASGLDAAHKLGIVHRDLKPDNILLAEGDENRPLVKIVDFGIAKMRQSTTETAAGLLVGTPAYMSFEQASGMRGAELDCRSDVYALGIVAYEMLTGRVPFYADTALECLRKHLTEPPPSLCWVRPDILLPQQVERAVMRALAKDREERYPSAMEFSSQFVAAVAAQPMEVQKPQAQIRDLARQEGSTVQKLKTKRDAGPEPESGRPVTSFLAAQRGGCIRTVHEAASKVGQTARANPLLRVRPARVLSAALVLSLGAAVGLSWLALRHKIASGTYGSSGAQKTASALDQSPKEKSTPASEALSIQREATIARLARRSADSTSVRPSPADDHGRQAAAPHVNRCRLLAGSRDAENAIFECREAIRLRPYDANVHSDLGLALGDEGDWNGDVAEQQEAIRLDPNYARARLLLSLALSQKGDWDGAIAQEREASQLSPKDATIHHALGVALAHKGEWNEAASKETEAIKLSPENPIFHDALGVMLARIKDWDGAIREEREVVRLAPRYAEAHWRLGEALGNKGDWDGQIKEEGEAINLDPRAARAYDGLGEALEHKGMQRAALEEFRQACQLDPTDPKIRNDYVQLARVLGEK